MPYNFGKGKGKRGFV